MDEPGPVLVNGEGAGVDLDFGERACDEVFLIARKMGVEVTDVVVEEDSNRVYRLGVRMDGDQRLIVGSGLVAAGDLDIVRAASAHMMAVRASLGQSDTAGHFFLGSMIASLFLSFFSWEVGLRAWWIYLACGLPVYLWMGFQAVRVNRGMAEIWKGVFLVVEDHQAVWRYAEMVGTVNCGGPSFLVRDQKSAIRRAARELAIDLYLPGSSDPDA